MKKIIYIFFLFIFFACEKEIQLDIPSAGKEIVVQAMIQEGYPPVVQLTWSDSYFATIDSNSYNNMFVRNAEITIYNKTKTESISLDEISTIIPELPPGLYTNLNTLSHPDFPYSNFFSEGQSYHLRVVFEGDTLSATTQIPHSTPLDSIWFVPDERYPEYGDFYIWYDDPDTMGNNVMFEHKRLAHFSLKKKVSRSDDVFIKAFGAVRNDIEGLNGDAFVSFFERGRSSNFTPTGFTNHKAGFANFQSAYYNDTVGEVFADTVLFRFSQLDKASFEFWRSVIAQDLMNGNPFAEPMNLKSNINGGLGVFEGKAAVYYKLIAREDTTFTQRVYPKVFEIL
jgi:hypothetical protein